MLKQKHAILAIVHCQCHFLSIVACPTPTAGHCMTFGSLDASQAVRNHAPSTRDLHGHSVYVARLEGVDIRTAASLTARLYDRERWRMLPDRR